jgi:2'-hydroxyisoflavone reductase
MDRGGEVLAPGDPDRELRVVDARDLGAFAVKCARDKVTGAFPATGPAGQTTFRTLLAECQQLAGSAATVTWVDDDFLVGHGVQPWSELPLWVPVAGGAGVWDQDTTVAERAGLRCRPVRETAADTLAWLRGGGTAAPMEAPRITPAGMTPEREAELLAAWHGR